MNRARTHYEVIRQAAKQYLDVFRDRQQERVQDQDGPKLVYICAPLRGDVEKNIEFARQKARRFFRVSFRSLLIAHPYLSGRPACGADCAQWSPGRS